MTSTFQLGIQQIDGRRWINERHEDALGRVHERQLLAPALADHQAVADTYGVTFEEGLKQAEIVEGERKLLTLVQLLEGIRERFRNASGEEAARIATWIMDKYDAGAVTATQLRTAFNMTNAELIELQTRLSALRTAYNAVRTGAGE